jgi:small GTP-binding protein
LLSPPAGHVDHGKTSLVQQLTGTDTDTLAEEKARGLTINTGFAYRHSGGESQSATTLGFVDVPGHSDFINNMLAGVSAVNAALLVIAVDDGIMPQTREHLAILDLLGIAKGAIALTKIDHCSPERLLCCRGRGCSVACAHEPQCGTSLSNRQSQRRGRSRTHRAFECARFSTADK